MPTSDVKKGPLYVDSTNNRVGVGTSSPSRQLHINDASESNIRLQGSSDYAELRVKDADNAFSFHFGGAERMRIDSVGRVLIGGTSTAPGFGNTVTGLNLSNDGRFFASVTSESHSLNRNSADGDILQFRKDGSTVGSIGNNTDFYIASSDGTGLRFTNSQILPSDESGNLQNTSRDLGASGSQFRDLYLSGGVNFGTTGGTVTGKTLDDYEEGSWTPYWGGSGSDPTVTYTEQIGTYTKVGRIVHATIRLVTSAYSGGSGSLRIKGLPFARATNGSQADAVTKGFVYNFSTDIDVMFVTGSEINCYSSDNANTQNPVSSPGSSAYFNASFTYRT